MSTRSSRSVVPLALFAAILVVALNTWFAVAAVEELVQSETWLAHTWEVVGQEEQLMANITMAESAVRGYVNSDREDTLKDYYVVQRSLPGVIERFRALTMDNSVQQTNLAEAETLIKSRMAMLQDIVNVRKSAGLDGAQELAKSGRGTTEMTKLRNVIDLMDAEERRLLANRASEVRSNGQRSLFAIALACVLDLLMIGFVTYYFLQERHAREASERQAGELALANAAAKKNAEEVQVLNAELEQRVRDRTSELEATNRELEAFSYSVSHDLRAPLRTIDGFSLALYEDYADVVDAVGQDYIRRVRTGVQRMGQLIDALLQLSRITRAEVTREETDVAKIAETVVAALKEENPKRDMTFTITPGPAVFADPKLVQVALENLLGNAVKFTARLTHADVSFGWDQEQKAWRVQDNGAGFDMHYADRLFNAFNRLHGDKDFKGSGIGLATVARVIRRHGGRIWADSEVDHGATFWFTLG